MTVDGGARPGYGSREPAARTRRAMTDPGPPRPRPAEPAEAAAIAACVRDAYAKYVPRIGKPPAPMLADYAALVAAGRVHVVETGGRLAGLLVLVDEPDHLHVENVAVHPDAQGRGLGRALMAFAEAEAGRRGYGEIRLYTHERMVENLTFYPALGYEETGRGLQDGYARVFFRKRLPAAG